MRLAICSTNRWKYSETFIQSHYQLLGENDLLLCDGYLPTSLSSDRGKTFKEIEGTGNDSENLMMFLHEQRITHILAEYGPAGVSILPICQKLGIALTVHFHGYDAYRNDVLGSYGKKYPELFSYAQSVIVVSADMEKQLQKLGCPNHKIHKVRYGVNTDMFTPDHEPAPSDKLLFCGRFVAKKNPELVVRAFSIIHQALPTAKLTMIGDGELLDQTKRLAQALNLQDDITFMGAQSHEQVAVEMKKHSILLQMSGTTQDNDSEGTPLSMLEAMSSSMLFIGTRHAGIGEVIQHKATGILIDEPVPERMAHETMAILNDPKILREIGKAARKFVVEHHGLTPYLLTIREIVMQKGE